MRFVIKKGLTVPLLGGPAQTIEPMRAPAQVAFTAVDHQGLKAQVRVAVGDLVKRGQLICVDKHNPGVCFTAPAAGRITKIVRGERRRLIAIVIELSTAERKGEPIPSECEQFKNFSNKTLEDLTARQIRSLLLESGLWTALRTRPFGKIPVPDSTPAAIFVTAIDTEPLAPDPVVVLREQAPDFSNGLRLIAKLTDGNTYLCTADENSIPGEDCPEISVAKFAGPHPAGLVGTHIHLLEPVFRGKFVWYLNYQDVVAIGKLFRTGILPVERVIALAGPQVLRPRLIKTRLGVDLEELTAGELKAGENRLISGSVLQGHAALDGERVYLGRYHRQITVIEENRKRELLGWLFPGFNLFSALPAVISRWLPRRSLPLTTSTNGSLRAIVPIGVYERVMPLDLEPTLLLRNLVVGDMEQLEQLGVLELEEEDLALCTFVCPSKIDYGPLLRRSLIEFAQEIQ